MIKLNIYFVTVYMARRPNATFWYDWIISLMTIFLRFLKRFLIYWWSFIFSVKVFIQGGVLECLDVSTVSYPFHLILLLISNKTITMVVSLIFCIWASTDVISRSSSGQHSSLSTFKPFGHICAFLASPKLPTLCKSTWWLFQNFIILINHYSLLFQTN